MEEETNRSPGGKNLVKKIGFYAILFLAGFLLSVFAREGLDAIKKTANLAAVTAGEAWSPSSSQKIIAKIPLNNPVAPKKSATSAKNSKSVIATKSVPAPIIKIEAISTATSVSPGSADIVASPASSSAPQEPQTQPTPVEPSPQVPQISSPPAPEAGPGHLVIAEIQISGGAGSSENDFIKFGNPTSRSMDISGWKIRKRTKTGTESSIRVIPDGIVVPAGETILWANSKNNFAANIGARIISSATISADNSVAILDSNGAPVDSVAWGGGANQFVEGAAFSVNPDGGQILKRKTQNGTWQDTDNNAADFSV